MEEVCQKVAAANSRTYVRLSNGLRNLTGMEGYEALLKLSHKSFRYARTEEEHQSIIDDFNIPEENIVYCADAFDGFKCICGKKHIYHLNIFEWQNENEENLIIGSKCIQTLAVYDKLNEEYPDLYNKVKEWAEIIKEETKKLNNNKCVSCNDYTVRKNYEYRQPQRKHWCKKCCYGDFVKCISCGKFRKYGYSHYHNKPLLECPQCYFSQSPPSPS